MIEGVLICVLICVSIDVTSLTNIFLKLFIFFNNKHLLRLCSKKYDAILNITPSREISYFIEIVMILLI